jgi:hypothetical protein
MREATRRHAVTAMATYYLITGAWPMFSMRSFEAVTGPKRDHWLVKTVAALVLANGAALALGAESKRISGETRTLALADALAFTAIDVIYVARRTIRPIYLADAAVELAFAALVR